MDQPQPSSNSNGRDVALVAIIVFAAHVATTSSGLFWLDSGDFTTASFVLGVPHATGFPLYTILGKLFCSIPIGPVAFRMCLLSGALAGAVSALILVLLRELGGDRWPTLTASLAASVALWATDVASLAGRVPDVYALHITLLALTLVLLVKAAAATTPARVGLLGFSVGLGMANHAEFRVFAIVVLAALIVLAWREHHAVRPVLGSAARWIGWAAIGLIPYLYLPIAAARGPYHVWGQPDSIGRFWDHFWGVSIQRAFGDEMLSASAPRLVWAAQQFYGQIVADFGVLLLLALGGAIVLARWRISVFVVTLVLAVVDALYSVVVNPMGLADLQNGAPTYLVLAVWLGVGTQWLTSKALGRPQWSFTVRTSLAGAFLGIVALLAIATLDPERRTFAGMWGAEDLAFESLQSAPSDALVLTDSEELAAAKLYLVGVGCLRPDVQALNRHELFDGMLLAKRSREGAFELADGDFVAEWADTAVGADDATFHERLTALLDKASRDGRTVLWEGGTASDARGRWQRIELGFPLHIMWDQPIERDRLAAWPVDHATHLRRLDDPWFRRWLTGYFTFLGAHFYRLEEWSSAETAFAMAREMSPERSSPSVNLAVLAARSGDFESAAQLAEEAIERDPLNRTAWLNLARYACVLGDRARALAAIESARALHADEARLSMIREFIRTCPPQ